MDNEAPQVVAGLIRDTLQWAMRQATLPAIADVEADGATVTLRDGFTERRFKFTVEEVA